MMIFRSPSSSSFEEKNKEIIDPQRKKGRNN